MYKPIKRINPGVFHSIGASFLFALIPVYIQLIPSIDGYALIGQRIIWTTILLAFSLILLRQFREVIKPLVTIKNWPGLLMGSLLIGIQWGVFVWAPLNGETLGLAMGYSLLPLVLVLIGRFLLNESLSNLQWAAAMLGFSAVLAKLVMEGDFSWVALIIALGYPLYFLLRRKQSIGVLSAFFIENLLLFPLAWWACVYYGDVNSPFDYSNESLLMFLGLGVLGSMGMLGLLSASRKLPIALFGLLGYLEPLFLFLISIFILGEMVDSNERLSYFLIATALFLLTIDGVRKLYRSQYKVNQLDT